MDDDKDKRGTYLLDTKSQRYYQQHTVGSTERSTMGKAHSDGIIMGITIDDERSVVARPNGEVGSLDDDDDDVVFGAALDFNRSTPACSR